MCEHLIELDRELKAQGIRETYRGQPWSDNCREWAYYDCVLGVDKIQERYQFPVFVQIHVNDDSKSGMEAGFYCDVCKDAIMGLHPRTAKGKRVID